ncbi:M28 family peptidase [Pedobacter punctiformis]|uniref:M28 family peptidase n=1 Tax=Pedobacter punctiformis TaxID=3004097 RepID=A0ABT4L4F4_9SPHI|nr:M28 family peptidase [Pedobacter sp. HCMS5-2]MCZ4242790.1 M28 family peptidase [Pedobacter sp. HCMS5-2]
MNKKFLTLSLASVISMSCFAQIKTLVPNKDAIKFGQAINEKNAYSHLSVLASDAYEGRETGKKGAWMAADYIRNYFKSLGLKGPVNGEYFQKIDLSSFNLTQNVLTINGQTKEFLKDFYILPTSVSTAGYTISSNSIVFAGYGMNSDAYNDFAGQNVAGKIVMIIESGGPATGKDNALPNRLKYLAEQKAAGVLVINQRVDNLSAGLKNFILNGQTLMKSQENIDRLKSSTILPIVTIGSVIANEILAAGGTSLDSVRNKIKSTGKPASLEINIPVSASAQVTETPLRCENVLGYLEGTDPKLKKEVLVLTGHYDHIGITPDAKGDDKINNGADDDGSGTTGVLLMAKAFTDAKKAGKGSKRSILFMTVVGEEKGLWGSDWYSEHPIFPLENTIADLNTDMIGRTGEEYLGKPDSANYIYSIGSNMLSSDLGKLSEQVNATYTKMKLDYKYDDPKDPERIYYRSDHYNFAKHGIPIIFYYDGMLQQDYHKPGDEISKINFPLLAKRAKLTYFTAWELANRPNRPVVDMDGKGNPKK